MNAVIVALTLCLINPAPGPVDGIEPRACYELAVYGSREECRISAVRLRVHTPGARLLCQPRPLSPDELLEIARVGGGGQ